MRRNKSFLLAFVLAATFSMTACTMTPFRKSNDQTEQSGQNIEESSEPQQESSQIKIPEAYQIYQLYLGQGGDLSYEEWLRTVRGEDGKDGHSPVVTIGDNGHWLIDGNDTGIAAHGDQGEKGDEGEKGEKGDKGDKGDTGKSAYEQYKEAHPEYTGTEEEWLDDLLNGRLATQITHTVSFNTNGGTQVADQTIVHGEKATKPADPTKVGYTFEGWEYNGEPWSFYGYVVTSDMVINAVWKAVDYVATFLNDDGTVLETLENVHYGDQLVYSGETPVKPNPEDHYLYTFTGWDKSLTVTGDMVFTAQYSKEYAPYEEKYYNYDDTLLYSRFMTAEMNSVKEAKVTWKNKTMSISEGARFEAEDAEFPNGIEKYYSNIASANYYIGCFQGGSVANFTFDCDTNIDVDMAFTIARDGDTLPLSDFWTIKVNGRTVDVSALTGPRTDGWESFVTIPGPHISLREGSNTISIRASEPLNVDYIELLNGTANDISSLIETPTRPTADGVKYMFHGWDLVSNENDVITYQAHFESCTNGLEFENNKVDIYHGSAKDVVVPAWWDGFRITEIGQTAFGGTDVETVVLPETITYIRDNAFNAAQKLRSINFPSSLVMIGTNAFQNCISLEEADLNEGLKEIYYHAFESSGLKRVVVPSTVERIHDNVFGGLKAEFIYIPATVTYIEWNAFWSSDNYINTIFCEREYRPSTWDVSWNHISNVVWGYKGIVEENGYKFAMAEVEGVRTASLISFDKTIKDVVIPDTVDGAPVVNVSATSITGNTTIETMVLPNSLKTITERLFYNCTNLRQVSIPDSVTEIGRYAFAHCDRLQSIVIPNSVEEVGEYCFEACLNLTSVQLSSSMKVLRTHLFASCNSLAHLEIPEGVESTEFAIVEYCDSLKSVTFPSTLKSLGNQTFFYNWGIDYFYLKCSKETWEGILETYNNDYDGIDRPAVLYYSEEAPTEAGDFWHYVNGVPTEW